MPAPGRGGGERARRRPAVRPAPARHRAARPHLTEAPQTWRDLPHAIWALGFVSLFMDTSSELIHALLPLFLVSGLGASTAALGVIEGVAEAVTPVTKLFSGAVSDRLGRRKLLAALGYGLAAASKPLFPLANTIGLVMVARCIDRVGKGIRGAPRDALVADITPPAIRGAAYGLRQALDSVGAFLGPLLAILLMLAYADRFRAALWWAVVPGVLSVGLLLIAVPEPIAAKPGERRGWPIRREDLRQFGRPYWWAVGIGLVFTLARFSEAFLVLKGRAAGLPLALAPVVMVWMNIVYAALATPAGAISDRIGRRKVLGAGLVALILADFVLAASAGLPGLFLGIGLWGVHMALSQGLLSALISDTAPRHLRGTGFGVFSLISGLGLLLASICAGELWDHFGPAATFAAGGGFAVLAALGLGAGAGWVAPSK